MKRYARLRWQTTARHINHFCHYLFRMGYWYRPIAAWHKAQMVVGK